MSIKDDFLKHYKEMILPNKPGADKLLEHLQKRDFFTAPASTKFHSNYRGGLVEHSVLVYETLKFVMEGFAPTTYIERPEMKVSMAVVGLLHDICKMETYLEDKEAATTPQKEAIARYGLKVPQDQMTKAYASKLIEWCKGGKTGAKPEFREFYRVEEVFPYGHGEKSVFILQQYIKLTEEEALAIRWHMGGFDPGIHFGYPSGMAYKQAVKDNKLLAAIIAADHIATYLVELWKD
jgi:hypothetical protein